MAARAKAVDEGVVGQGGKVGGGGGFDEGKARMKLALVFAVIGVACLTGAPVGGKILGMFMFMFFFSFRSPILILLLSKHNPPFFLPPFSIP